jgi:alkylation response protein AidB-like acyl-CoA dehydrogenase
LVGSEMGLAGLGLPEETGGAGGGLAELAAVAEELGRALLPVPFLSSTVFAGQVLARCAASDVVEQLASGEALAALAAFDTSGVWSADRVEVTATASAGGWRLTGTAPVVLDGSSADWYVVPAAGPEGIDVFLVAGGDAEPTRLETVDLSRSVARVRFADAAGRPLTSGGAGAAAMDPAMDAALVVLAAEQVGGAQACLDMAVGYAKIRIQFGRPIGSFQAVKHKLADLLLQVEMARSAVDRAVRGDAVALPEAAAVAQAWCSDAFRLAAAENVHVHGGVGFTWEHDAHLYFRRARADAAIGGDAAYHRERLATLLGW